MLDLNVIPKRYFEIKLADAVINVEPPRVKTLKKISTLSKASEEDSIDELKKALSQILNKNKEKINADRYIDDLDIDQVNLIFIKFFEWIEDTAQSKN